MKKQFLNLGKALNKAEQKSVNGGQIPSYCFDNEPGYREECREIALGEFADGGCPTWNPCFSSGPMGCTDMCMSDPGSR
ncbi:hypothetical protein MKD41_00265 [Lutibacter sp. A64]|uniref:hypothetical protein n=1 Tax=Lutibacter sp. A64 TaxID=2918526 RepID=UPI001F06E1EA|nr:hypothetical protein [Lutibacter sp. A64]UMB53932.1 hypothetical protein MKD41_00265 [Lutibacter sp. A64]